MSRKPFGISCGDIKPIATGYGACICSNRIISDGKRVGYCYREAPDSEIDSGWRFLSGDETQAYADNPENFSLYDINTVANFDPSIVVLLRSEVGSVYERRSDGDFIRVQD